MDAGRHRMPSAERPKQSATSRLATLVTYACLLLLAREVEIDLQCDVILDAQHDGRARRSHAEYFESRLGGSRAGQVLARNLARRLPGDRLRNAVDGQIAGKLEAHIARAGQRRRQTLDSRGHEDGGRVLGSIQGVAPD